MKSMEKRFWAKVDKSAGSDGCWLWTGGKSLDGYGQFTVTKKTRRAHRIAYEMLVGPIPEGLQIDHLCRTRACVNPAHMEIVTNAENVRRGIGPTAQNARKTHCPQGHELSGYNLFMRKRASGDGPPYRQCRKCLNATERRTYHRQMAKLRETTAAGSKP